MADDLVLMGPGESVFKAFDKLVESTRRSGLVVRPRKCAFLWPSMDNVPDAVSSLAAERKIKVCQGSMEVFGAPVGCGSSFTNFLSGYLKSQSRFFELLLRPDLSASGLPSPASQWRSSFWISIQSDSPQHSRSIR